MYNLEHYLNECAWELLDLKFPIKPSVIELGKPVKSYWAKCRFDSKRDCYIITINSILADVRNPVSALKNTIIHELIHTIPGCMNHGKYWKAYAKLANRKLGYHITVSSTASEEGITFLPDGDGNMISVENCRQAA